MEIFVETPTGEKRALQVEATETFASIKAKYIRESGGGSLRSSARSFRLQGQVVSEDRTPRYYQIKNGDTLHWLSNMFEIFIDTPTGEMISLEVNRYDTIRQVKIEIEEKTEILSRRQLLLFADSPLEDSKTVDESNLKDGDTVDLIDNGIDIFIKMSTGKRIFFVIYPNDTIESVKEQIQTKEGIPQQYQDLFYGRKKLEDGHTLQEYKIPSGVTLQLVQLVIQIFVEMPKAKISLDVLRNDTIGDVKGKIEEKEGVLRENQNLYFYRTSLEDEDRTLNDYKIKQGSKLTLGLNDIEIDISMPSGERLPLNVNLNETISSVKDKIEEKKGIRRENQFLFYALSGGWAKDEDTVKSHIRYYYRGGKRYLDMAHPCVSISVAMFTSRLGKRFSLDVNRNDTIAAVKSKIAQQEGDINLENHFLCLGDVRLSEKCTLQSCLPKKSRFTCLNILFELRQFYDISISVNTLNGNIFPIAFHPNDTVRRVKEYIQDKRGIPPDEQRLIFARNQLEDSRTMVSYNIKNGDTLLLVLRLRGGI